jgi:hypothetical protein
MHETHAARSDRHAGSASEAIHVPAENGSAATDQGAERRRRKLSLEE